MYNDSDFLRLESEPDLPLTFRSDFWRDYARISHSPAFRRLVGKTQLFPGNESDFFRNRLTHSIEVAQIAKTIARKCNEDILVKLIKKVNSNDLIDTDLIELSCHAHDIGHPPFGHQGEKALDDLMIEFGGFEGNAQTFRILTVLEKKSLKLTQAGIDNIRFPQLINSFGVINSKDYRGGLNLTYRSLASILKYDNPIPLTFDQRKNHYNEKLSKKQQTLENELEANKKDKELAKIGPASQVKQIEIKYDQKIKIIDHQLFETKTNIETLRSSTSFADDISILSPIIDPIKGYYNEDKNFVEEIKINLGYFSDEKMKTIECQIMDIADDISYATFDFEDSLQAEFINPLDLVTINEDIQIKIFNSINNKYPEKLKSIGDIQKKLEEIFGIIFRIDFKDEPEEHESKIMEIRKAYNLNKLLLQNGYARSGMSSRFIDRFIKSVDFVYNKERPILSEIKIGDEELILLEVLKKVTFELQVQSSRLKIVEFRGQEIVKSIFNAILESKGDFLPRDYKTIYNSWPNGGEFESKRMRTICDFIAGMTDKYAVEFYGRLKSEMPQTIFKRM